VSAVLAPGASFGGYRIERLVGRGGMGVVYQALDESLERPVALKLIVPELAGDERFRRRFEREPRLAAALDHPNLLPVYEAGERDGQLYLAMRYVEGSDLGSVLAAERTLPPERALDVLGQVAGALDAAHERGLVHRDVKPANVLVDAGGHAYLTDFGVSKLAAAHTTEAGPVGTLDYLAPEQIRGEPVDGRGDQYALACLLYECLAGAPPFRRETQAETLWAHLHEDPPPVAPALDPVLRRGLAKERDDRFATCGELIAAAGAALAPGAKPPRRRHRAALAVAGGVLLLAVAAAAALEEGGGHAPRAPTGSGVAVLGPADGRVSAFVESVTAPSDVAVGEGAVWVLSTQDATVTRIDPLTKAVTRFSARSVPSKVAAGGGAVWIGNGHVLTSVSRVDPRTLRITRTQRLPNPGHRGGTFSPGDTKLVVGAGAVWAIDRDDSVARIDERSGRVVATVPAHADQLAAGDAGVWVLSGGSVVRIDPATNRLGRPIRLPAFRTRGIAVGGGAVWVLDDQEGQLWRVDPATGDARTIGVGTGATYVAYGAGAVWVANLTDGFVSRVDPRTSRVTRTPIGAPLGVAAGDGAAWVSTGGPTDAGTLPSSACNPIESAVREPDVLIVSDLPLLGDNSVDSRRMTDAIRLVLKQHHFRAGRFAVGYQSCDESTAQVGNFDIRRCAANANAFAHVLRVVAEIGPWSSFCAQIQLATLNRAPGGPVSVIAPSATDTGLTRANSLLPSQGGYLGEPGVYYPTGVRHFVRLQPSDDLGGTALAVLAHQLGLRRVYLFHNDIFKGLLTDPFRRAAAALGVRIAADVGIDGRLGYAALAQDVSRSGADGVVVGAWANGQCLAGPYCAEGGRLVRALRARLGRRVALLSSFGFDPDEALPVGAAARGMYVATVDVPWAPQPTAAARRFSAAFGAGRAQSPYVLQTAQATELALGAIARSDGTRASVLKRLRASRVRDGILGSFRFDRFGDPDPETMAVFRLTRRRAPGDVAPGAAFDRVVTIPARLRG
jgi:ABC-type branched-subunit amino acid transport system substrate-binding protein/streptogramin lyase